MRSNLQSSFRMKIPERNIAGRVLYFMGTLFLLFNLIAIDVESKLEDGEPLLDHLVESGMINQEMAELLQSNCMVEFLHTKKTLLSLDSHLTGEKSNDADDLINDRPSRAKLHNTINNFLPQINQVLVDCVREKKLIFRITEREKDSDSTTWYEDYFGFLFTSNRRVLAETPIESPAPSPSFTSPSPSPSIFPDDTQNPSASPPKIPFFPPDLNKSDLQPSANEASSNGSNVGSNGQKTSKRTVIIAVVVTASVTLLAALLLFLFWQRCCGKSGRRNDERPLLSLSLSDYSIASPHKSFGLGASIDEEKLGNNQSLNSKPNHNDKVNTNYYMESHSLSNPKIEATIVNTSFTNIANLENSQVSISPALPPPPGRTNPPKPPPSNVSPPTPPAPPAMPFSGGPRPPPPLPPQVKPPPSTGGPRPPPPGPPPPPRPAVSSGPRPPPPPLAGGGVPPPRPPNMGLKPPRPLALGPRPPSSSSASVEDGGAGNNNKAKLKPFFWDKVLANPDQSMVWHQIKSGSFQFNEEMIETLFGYAPADKTKNETKKESSSQDVQNQFIRLIDPKKAQNLAIMLKALNVTTEEVCDALEEGNELPPELIQTLLKMAPTTDEELKLRLYSGDVSQLGPAERFLKVLVDIPHAFKRLESLLFMSTIQEDVSMLKESFEVLEAACTELRKSRLFLKLLEAVLKTGNRMNDGTFRGGAQAFKLDTLLKLSDVKGTDGKTTLLHFVVQEIIRSEGIKAVRTKALETHSSSSFKSYNKSSFENAITEEEDSDEHFRSIGLQVVSGLTYELENVKKAANLDLDSITTTVSKLGKELKKSRDFSNNEMKNVSKENGFCETLKSFIRNAEVDVMWSFEEEKRIMALVKSTTDYFHGSNSGRDEGLRLFVIVRDFLVILDKVCKEVKDFPVIKANKAKTKKGEGVNVEDSKPVVHVDHRQRLFPAIAGRRIDSSSSDDES